MVQDLEFRVQSLGCRVKGEGFGCMIHGLGFRV